MHATGTLYTGTIHGGMRGEPQETINSGEAGGEVVDVDDVVRGKPCHRRGHRVEVENLVIVGDTAWRWKTHSVRRHDVRDHWRKGRTAHRSGGQDVNALGGGGAVEVRDHW